METISALLDQLRISREDVRCERFVEAARGLTELKPAMPVEESGEEEPAVYWLLREEWMECFDELQEVLARHAERCVRFETEGNRIVVRSAGDAGGPELLTALEAMEIAGVMDYGLARVADLIIKHVIRPVIVLGSMNVCIGPHQNSFEKSETILSLVQSVEYQENLCGDTIYPRLIQVLEFIFEFICFKNFKWMQCFGRLSWSRISDLIINHFLSKVVADDLSHVVPFQHIIDHTTTFESSLKEMMFISKNDISEERLSNFMLNVEVHFASRKRNAILAKARSILLQLDSIVTLTNISSEIADVAKGSSKNAVDLLFQPERCYISKSASQLMELVHETLKDACISSTRVAKEFYHAARDALLLYTAIIPVKLVKKLDTISQEAIVIHNDCYFLSQEILALSFQYRTDFPSDLKEHAIFVDMAPKFYEASVTILEKQAQLFVNSLREAIDGANGFQDTYKPEQYESAKSSIDEVVSILEEAHIMWEPLMPPSVYMATTCTLLDFVFSRVVKDMLFLDDIAAEETLQLQSLIHILLEHLASFFESLLVGADEKEQFVKNQTWAQLEELIPSLRKLRKLSELLDMPLKSITTTWESGELATCGFTSSQVETFIKAIFADSPLRKECLWRIESIAL